MIIQFFETAFEDPFLKRMILSCVLLIIFSLVSYLIKKPSFYKKATNPTTLLVVRWTSYFIMIAYFFVLIPIWFKQDQLTQFLNTFGHPVLDKLFKSLLLFIPIQIVLFFIRRFINSLHLPLEKKHRARKHANLIGSIIFLILLVPLWAGTSHEWTTILSVIGAGVALALHDVLLNLAGWAYIAIRRPFKTGDRIEIDGVKGDVIDIRYFVSTLLEVGNWVDAEQSTGRVVDVPHGHIFRKPMYNYTKGFEYIWNEYSVLITFESQWEKLKAFLTQCGDEESHEIQTHVKTKIDRMANKYLIYYHQLTPIVYTRILDSGIQLTLRYLTDAKLRRSGENNISQKVLHFVNEAKDIDFAYPTIRYYK